MSCDRDICATNEYNGIGCDECGCNDTAVQREQDAYDSGFAKAIERMLDLIDEVSDEWLEDNCEWDWHGEMKKRVSDFSDLKGEKE